VSEPRFRDDRHRDLPVTKATAPAAAREPHRPVRRHRPGHHLFTEAQTKAAPPMTPDCRFDKQQGRRGRADSRIVVYVAVSASLLFRVRIGSEQKRGDRPARQARWSVVREGEALKGAFEPGPPSAKDGSPLVVMGGLCVVARGA
jgi:hypothetical protein